MSVKTYDINADGEKYLSEHSQVKEYGSYCDDWGRYTTNEVLVDDALPEMLEKVFAYLGCSYFTITSGYRDYTFEMYLAGFCGYHNTGKAADCVFYDANKNPIPSSTVACVAQELSVQGIGVIGSYSIHLDTRDASAKWWGDERNGASTNDWYSYFGITERIQPVKPTVKPAETPVEDVSDIKVITSTPTREKPLFGIDVSYSQGHIDWDTVKSHIDFAILRCGYGDDMTDQDDAWWVRNVSECERLGIPYGVYLYSYADNAAHAESEAAHAIRLLQGHKPAYPVYIDLEQSGCESFAVQAAEIFCRRLKDAGYRPGVYTYLSWLRSYIGHDLDHWPMWVAQYNYECNWQGPYDIWQNASDGCVPGISGDVDTNYCYTSIGGECKEEEAVPVKPFIFCETPHIEYAVKTKNHGILLFVKDRTDFAGIDDDEIIAVTMRSDIGHVEYAAHTVEGKWLSTVSGSDWNDFNNGYAGDDHNAIDMIKAYYYTDRTKTNGDLYECVYQVKAKGKSDYYPDQHDYNTDHGQDGYAGTEGNPIIALKMSLEKI